jgi:hypothetical protein
MGPVHIGHVEAVKFGVRAGAGVYERGVLSGGVYG